VRPGLAAAALAVLVAVGSPASADVSFKGKVLTVLVGTTAGGSTDASARLIANFMGQHLPGKPEIIVVNRPGAKGLTAQNYFTQQVKPDGLTILLASGSQIDPTNYRVPQSKYDPTKYALVGGLDIGGAFLVVRRESLAALTDKSKPPVVMGSVPGVPRSGMNMTAWGVKYLDWNARWISGYPGTPDLMMALDRGEIGMTAFANQEMKKELLDKNRFAIIYQSGINAGTERPDMDGLREVPLFAEAMKGKFNTEVEKKAFEYWRAISSIIKWAALPPNTPADISKVYRAAFNKMVESAEFKERSRKMNEEATIIRGEELEKQVQALADLPPEALGYMLGMLKEQGLKIQEGGFE
jgi:hypothetical protein